MAEAQIIDLEASPLSKAPIIEDLTASLQCELNKLIDNTNETENTIFRIPHIIYQSKKNLFEPFVISIGPFHHGKEHLRALEKQKLRFLRDFLFRGDHISLDLCISAMKFLEERTRRCYSETFDYLDSNAFVEMMLLDGCFVFEYLFNFSRAFDYSSNFIQRDLLLIENQIPFFIVHKLCEIVGFQEGMRSMDIIVKHAASTLLRPGDIIPNPPNPPNPLAEIHHLTHLFYHLLVPNPDNPIVLRSKSLSNSTWNISTLTISTVIPSVTELILKGCKFRPKLNPKHMFDISFEYGVLKIPKLQITNDTKTIFANLIVFEQSRKVGSHFTSFVIFLRNLINTQNDVKMLQLLGIIDNRLGSEEEVVHFINQVTEGSIIGKHHYLAELFKEVNLIASEWNWNKFRAKLIREYFRGRWKGISISAIIILVLTFIQTYYTVYAYKFPPSP